MTTQNTPSRVLRFFKDLSIGRKLNFAFGVLVALTLLVVGLSYLTNSQAITKIDRTEDLRVPTTLTSAQAQTHLLSMLANIRGYLVLGDSEYRNAYNQAKADFKANLSRMKTLSSNWTNPENNRRLAELEEAFEAWSALPDQMFNLHNDTLTNQPAQRILTIEAQPAIISISADIAAMIEAQANREPSVENMALLKDMADFESSFTSMVSALRGYLATDNPILKFDYQDSLAENQSAWNRLVNTRTLLTPDQSATLDDIAQNRESFLPLPQKMFEAFDNEHAYEDLFLLRTEAVPLAEEMLRILDEMTADQRGLLQIDLEQGSSRLAVAQRWTLAGGVVALILGAGLAFVFGRSIAGPIIRLTDVAAQIAGGTLAVQAPVESSDEVGTLAETFNDMTDQLRGTLQNLEQQTHDLEQRSRYLEASAEVSHAATSILDADQLIHQVVELIRERFGLYYVGLFRVDEAGAGAGGKWAVLQAGTGEAGRTMLARGHRIRIGEGMIGWSIAHAQARVASEAEIDAVRLKTAELPDTRSEAALPLRSRGQIIGALTVQDDQPNAFDEQVIATLQIMADQVAVAIDNARLLAESQTALEAERRAYGELSRQAWTELLHTHTDWGYRYAHGSITPTEGNWRPEMRQAEQSGQAIYGNGSEGSTLSIPIKLRDQVIAVLGFRKGETNETWTAEEATALETLADQLGVALDNARLHQDTQRRAVREQLAGEVTARMRESLDVNTVLRTAAREMRQALNLAEVEVRMGSGLGPASDETGVEVEAEVEDAESSVGDPSPTTNE